MPKSEKKRKIAYEKGIRKRSRKFGGKKYNTHLDTFSEDIADKETEKLREKGWNARIIKHKPKKNEFFKPFYRVFKRRKE